jgi:hypothetical protein
MHSIRIDTNNIDWLISNEQLFIKTLNGTDYPISKDEHRALSFNANHTARLALFSDEQLILDSPVKEIHFMRNPFPEYTAFKESLGVF